MFVTANVMMDFIEWYLRKAVMTGLVKRSKAEVRLRKMNKTLDRLDKIQAAMTIEG